MNEYTKVNSVSLMDIVGAYSALLILAVIAIGISALIIRKRRFSIFCTFVVIGIALCGMGATFWNLSAMNRMQLFGHGGVDPYQWLGEFGLSCARAGAVLPACGISMILVGLSFMFEKSLQKNIEQAAT